MKFSKRLPLILIPAIVSFSSLVGQTFDFTASSVIANGDLNKMVRSNNLAGHTFGFGYKIAYGESTHVRTHFNLFGVKGIQGSGIDNVNRYAFNMGIDLMNEYKGVTFYVGLMGMSWRQNTATNSNFLYNNTTTQNTASPTLFFGGNNIAGNDVKYGYRAGLEYPIVDKLYLNFNFTQTEFNKVYSPSYFALGVTYRY